MKTLAGRWFFPLACLLAALAPAPCRAAGDDWQPAFNGRDLSGWVVEGTTTFKRGDQTGPVWSVDGGVIRCAGGGFGFLRFDRRLCDFALRAEYRLEPRSNSGIGIRTVPFVGTRATRPSFAGYEIQLLDDAGRPPDDHGTGSLYRYLAPKENPSLPAGQWNTIRVECRGPRVAVWINDRQVQDVDQSTIAALRDKPLCGFACLQNHGSPAEFRHIEFRELAPAK